MSLTITFEKKHFLLAGLVIAIPFLILAISQIIAASPPSGQYHPVSELWVNSDIDLQGNKVINMKTPTASDDAATKGYVDAAGGSGGDYFVSINCEGKTSCAHVDPWIVPLSSCPVGCAEIYYADGVVGDASMIGTNYQRFGNIIVNRQKTLYAESQGAYDCHQSKSLSAWDVDSGKEFKDTASVGHADGVCVAECGVSCSIRVCSCS